MAYKQINILLIGESGVGKSTFINSFAHYCDHQSFEEAQKSLIQPLVPTKFPIRTESLNQKFVTIDETKNKNDNEENSVVCYTTKNPLKYSIPWKDNIVINFIDTPGVGNERGTARDQENFAAVLKYLQRFDQLHAICFFSKPNISIITPFFDFCINQLLNQFDNAACAKMLFVFTNTRVTDYKALDTFTNLKGIVQKIRNDRGVQIPLNYSNTPENNVFCMDNEGYKYLVAKQQGVLFGDAEIMEESWDVSRKECFKMMRYIEQNIVASRPQTPPIAYGPPPSVKRPLSPTPAPPPPEEFRHNPSSEPKPKRMQPNIPAQQSQVPVTEAPSLTFESVNIENEREINPPSGSTLRGGRTDYQSSSSFVDIREPTIVSNNVDLRHPKNERNAIWDCCTIL